MGTRALPDMYALSPRACGPRASGIHIRQSTRAHVITYTYICACIVREIYRRRMHNYSNYKALESTLNFNASF